MTTKTEATQPGRYLRAVEWLNSVGDPAEGCECDEEQLYAAYVVHARQRQDRAPYTRKGLMSFLTRMGVKPGDVGKRIGLRLKKPESKTETDGKTVQSLIAHVEAREPHRGSGWRPPQPREQPNSKTRGTAMDRARSLFGRRVTHSTHEASEVGIVRKLSMRANGAVAVYVEPEVYSYDTQWWDDGNGHPGRWFVQLHCLQIVDEPEAQAA